MTIIDYHDPQLPYSSQPGSGPDAMHRMECRVLPQYDAAVVCAAHPVDYAMLAEHVPLIVDACNVVPKQKKDGLSRPDSKDHCKQPFEAAAPFIRRKRSSKEPRIDWQIIEGLNALGAGVPAGGPMLLSATGTHTD